MKTSGPARFSHHIRSNAEKNGRGCWLFKPPPSPCPRPSSRPLCHSLERTAGSNKTHTHPKTAKCPSERDTSLNSGLCLFLQAIWLVKHASFCFQNSFSVKVRPINSFTVSNPWEEVKMDKWWCAVSINTKASSSAPLSLRTNGKSRIKTFYVNTYIFASSFYPDSSVSQARCLSGERT